MLKDFTIANLLDLNETIAKDLFEGKTYPWEVLPEIGGFILKLGQTLSEEEYNHPSEDVWIAKSVALTATLFVVVIRIGQRPSASLGRQEQKRGPMTR